jgi:hypothetical protein
VALQALDDIKTWCRAPLALERPTEALADAAVYYRLFIGDLRDVTLQTCLRCNCAAVLVLYPEELPGKYHECVRDIQRARVEVYQLQIPDTDGFEDVFFKALGWAAEFLKRDETVLIVSQTGANSAVAIAAGCLVFFYDLGLVPVVQDLTQRRGDVLTNRKFRVQLVKVCVAHGKNLGVVPSLLQASLQPMGAGRIA